MIRGMRINASEPLLSATTWAALAACTVAAFSIVGCSASGGNGSGGVRRDERSGSFPPSLGTETDPGAYGAGGDILDDADAPGASDDELCAGSVFQPETLITRTPVSMFLAIDNSVSMTNISSGGVTNWERAVTALKEFVTAPSSAGIGVALQYFRPAPHPDVKEEYDAWVEEQRMLLTPDQFSDRIEAEFDPERWAEQQNKCDGVTHATSAVTYGRIPDVANDVVDFLRDNPPQQGGTFTVGALAGAVNFCADFQTQNPDERCVAILVTDGQPNGCGLGLGCTPGFTPNADGECVDPDAEGILVPIAQGGANRNVDIYTVGMDGVGADGFNLLNEIAIAGGTDCNPDVPGAEACNVTTGGGASLLDALNRIRAAVVQEIRVPCTWTVPPPPEGEVLDPRRFNVDVTVNGASLALGQVQSAGDCASVVGGWYYDNPNSPTEIRTCRQTCDIIEGNPDDVRVSVQVGCTTRVAIPR